MKWIARTMTPAGEAGSRWVEQAGRIPAVIGWKNRNKQGDRICCR